MGGRRARGGGSNSHVLAIVGPSLFTRHVAQGALNVAAGLAVLLNAAIVALAPLFSRSSEPQRPPDIGCSDARRQSPIVLAEQHTSEPIRPLRGETALATTTSRRPPVAFRSTRERAALEQPPAVHHAPRRGDVVEALLTNSLQPLAPGAMRLLPDAAAEARMRRRPCWLTFGVSSVNRRHANYLGITLSHLFEALGAGTDGHEKGTALVVHLADFDVDWVDRTSAWLNSSFSEEVETGRLHVIHAPERLYTPREQLWRMKFNDPPYRQWWRSKQNMDYSFLMWYCTGLSEFYMQLEDDIQVVPNFLPTVTSFMKKVDTEPWVMVAFSKLGFIGKVFNATTLPKLAEFLYTFHDESPCDWLVWVFIDAMSSRPVTVEIAEDLEQECAKRAAHRRDPNFKLPNAMRDDIAIYYKEIPEELFRSKAATLEVKPNSGQVAPPAAARYPTAIVLSTMTSWKDHVPEHAYPPGGTRSFWTGDTCWPRKKGCDATGKFIELVFDEVVSLRAIETAGGSTKKPNDYIRNGSLEIAPFLDSSGVGHGSGQCTGYVSLAQITQPRTTWEGTPPFPARCLRVVLREAQEAWVMFRFVRLEVQHSQGQAAEPHPGRALASLDPQEQGVGFTAGASQHDTGHISDLGSSPPESGAKPRWWAILPAADEGGSQAAGALFQGWARSAWKNWRRSAEGVDEAISTLLTGWTRGGWKSWRRLAEGVDEAGVAYAALLASLLGVASGLAGWLFVFAGWRVCGSGLRGVGEFPCWAVGFVMVLDMLLVLAMVPPPPPPEPGGAREKADWPCPADDVLSHAATASSLGLVALTTIAASASTTPSTLTTTTTPSKSSTSSAAVRLRSPRESSRVTHSVNASALDWRGLRPGLERLALSEFWVMGSPPSVSSLASTPTRWLAVGLPAALEHPAVVVADTAQALIRVGGGEIIVVVSIRGGANADHKKLVVTLRTRLARDVQRGLLHVVRVPEALYLPQGRRENIDDAALLLCAQPLAALYMQVEPQCALDVRFPDALRTYINKKGSMPWHVISLSKFGFQRKVIKTHMLPRMAAFLAMFPHVPADALFWDFVDVVSNITVSTALGTGVAPKSCKIASEATKIGRHDVILQYHKADALIEHMGDVSSLSGKVQRIRDDFFQKHALVDTLFDSPPAVLHSNFQGAGGSLQTVYGQKGAAGPENARPVFMTSTPMKLPESGGDAFFEIVFHAPTVVHLVLIRMGGAIRPASKKQKNKEQADPDFGYVLQSADLEFGYRAVSAAAKAVGAAPACASYDRVANVSGREAFWRGQQNSPADGVVCIRVAIRRRQQTPLVVRDIRVRSMQKRPLQLTQGMASPRLPARAPAPLVVASTLSSLGPPETTALAPLALRRSSSPVPVETAARLTPLPASQLKLIDESAEDLAAVERWAELHLTWALTVSVAFGAGALGGVLGCTASRLGLAPGIGAGVVKQARGNRNREI